MRATDTVRCERFRDEWWLGVHVVRLWERNLGWARLFRAGDTLVVHDEDSGGPDCPTRSFCLSSREPLGPVFGTWETICLADLPERWPSPVLGHVGSQTLVISDPRDGALLERIPLLGVGEGRSLDDLALARIGERDRLYLFEGAGSASCGWGTADLDSTKPVVHWSDPFMLYSTARERIALAGGWLAVPAEEYVDFLYDDPQSYPEILEEPRVRVYRASDGCFLGQVEADGIGEAEVATVGGHTYLAQGWYVRSLPDLAPVVGPGFGPRGSSGIALAEWEGRPVAVFARAGEDMPQAGERDRPLRLVHCFLDDPANLDRSPSAFAEIPWDVPGDLYDLLATPNREVVVATSEGVYVVTVAL